MLKPDIIEELASLIADYKTRLIEKLHLPSRFRRASITLPTAAGGVYSTGE